MLSVANEESSKGGVFEESVDQEGCKGDGVGDRGEVGIGAVWDSCVYQRRNGKYQMMWWRSARPKNIPNRLSGPGFDIVPLVQPVPISVYKNDKLGVAPN